MMVDPPEEWKMPEAEQVGDKNRTTTGQAPDNLPDKLPDNLPDKLPDKLTPLNPALKEKFVRMRYPDKPHHPRQKYLLTTKGTVLYNEIISSH